MCVCLHLAKPVAARNVHKDTTHGTGWAQFYPDLGSRQTWFSLLCRYTKPQQILIAIFICHLANDLARVYRATSGALFKNWTAFFFKGKLHSRIKCYYQIQLRVLGRIKNVYVCARRHGIRRKCSSKHNQHRWWVIHRSSHGEKWNSEPLSGRFTIGCAG